MEGNTYVIYEFNGYCMFQVYPCCLSLLSWILAVLYKTPRIQDSKDKHGTWSRLWTVDYTNGLVQERHNSIANALELRLSCTKPSISWDSKLHQRPMSLDEAHGCCHLHPSNLIGKPAMLRSLINGKPRLLPGYKTTTNKNTTKTQRTDLLILNTMEMVIWNMYS